MRAMLPLPAQVERFIRLPAQERKGRVGVRFILLEELVLMFLDRVFPGFKVTSCGLFRLIRDTDVEFEEEAEDLVRSYETALKRRRRGVVIHLHVDPAMPEELRATNSMLNQMKFMSRPACWRSAM
jgi:polyphosphate kinase